MSRELPHGIRAGEAAALAQIGRYLLEQPTRVLVRIPVALADAAVAAWEREDGETVDDRESPEERHARHRAGALALIGCALADRGVADGGDIEVELDAWQIGDALNAADDVGLI